MKSIEELTLHAYGLLDDAEKGPIEDHLVACGSCAATVEALRAEHRLFERAAEPDETDSSRATERILSLAKPAGRSRSGVPVASLVAAVVLLATLAWLLFLRGPTPPISSSTSATSQASTDDVDRLVAELKSKNGLRGEVAAHALKAYGREAVPKLETSEAANATLIIACREAIPRGPVRPVREHESAPVLVLALRSTDEDKRAQAKAGLLRLGFGAEKELWAALDAPQPHVRDAAAELLRRLYTPAEEAFDHASLVDFMRRVGHPIDFKEATVFEIIDQIRNRNFRNTVFEPEAETVAKQKRASIEFTGSWYGHYTLVLDVADLHFIAEKGRIVIRKGERSVNPWVPLWLPPAEAKRIQALLDALSLPDPAEEDKALREVQADHLESRALDALRQAAWLLEGGVKDRARAIRQKLLEKVYERSRVDIISGVDLQELTDPQRAILQRRVDANGAKFEKMLADAGVKCRMVARPDQDRTITIKGVRIAALLKAFTRPYDLDFYMDGESVVIDTAVNVRQAVEK